MSNYHDPTGGCITGGCIKCAKCEIVRTAYFCGRKKLTEKQVYNSNGYCSEFIPKKKGVENERSD